MIKVNAPGSAQTHCALAGDGTVKNSKNLTT